MIATVATALLLAAAPAAGAQPPRPRAAVLDLRAVQGVQPGTAAILTAIVVSDVSRAGFDVMSQADIASLLGVEQQKQVLGCTEDAGCLAEIGGALGADQVLSGQVGQIGTRYHVSLQLLDAKKARVLARSAQFSAQNEDALAAAAQAAVAELIATSGIALVPRGTSAAVAVTAAPAAKTAPSAPGWRPSRALAWITTGAGLVVAGAGAASLGLAQARQQELADGWQRTDYAAFYDQTSAEARRFQTFGYVGVGAGALATGVGVFFLVRSAGSPVALLPDVAPGRAGLVAFGSF
jgi:TolB-like protein